MGLGMFVLYYQSGQIIILTSDTAADPQDALRRICEDTPDISVTGLPHSGRTVLMGIRAPRQIQVQREMLVAGSA
ncbi:hypothetical protein D3C78_1069900 [compost metagenome]